MLQATIKITRVIAFILLATFSLTIANEAHSQDTSAARGLGITRLVISDRHVVFGGESFATAGQYELLTGKAYGELDPHALSNGDIVNLDLAPLDGKGHVEYSVDISILKPVDINRGNGRILYDVLNRGRKPTFSALDEGGASFGSGDAGNGFLMKHGYTVVWSGWQADLPNTPGFMRSNFPIASHNGEPVIGSSREEFTDVPSGPAFTEKLTYPAATLDPSSATLTVREHESDPRQSISPSDWKYEDATSIRITAADGMDRGAIYEFIYSAKDPVVAGIAFAATRDFVSFLRYATQDNTGQPNPVRQQDKMPKATLGFGMSQSGRFLKDFVYQGFNRDILGRIVFDGIMPVQSGSRRTFTNYQFAQPGRFTRQHEDHLYPGDQFPFSYAKSHDSISGKTDGLLVKCTESKTCPRIIHADSDTEVWQGRDSLIVTDTSGHPLALPDNVRVYMFSGLPHIPVPGPLRRGECEQYQSPVSFSPYARALFVALDDWVSEGIAPPPSAFPNLGSRSLVTLERARKLYPTIPGVPFSPVINQLQVIDSEVMPPVPGGPSYPLLVPPFNADGNPIGGIEPPEITVPIATYSGRNVRAAGFAQGDLCSISGEDIPFAATRKERLAERDSRLSLEERYSGQQDYSRRREHAVRVLVRERFVLPEDAAALASGSLSVSAGPANSR